MSDPKNLESLVNQAVNDVLTELLPSLRKQLVRQVMQVLAPELGAAPASQPAAPAPPVVPADDTNKLNECLAKVQAGTTQVEILDAMIEGASQFAARTALFVVRGANAVGWRARGFSDNEGVRSSPLELTDGLAAKAIQARGMVSGPSSEFNPEFADKFGGSAQDSVMLPLLVRDKAVALVYADAGSSSQPLDCSALQSLVRMTGLWLEVFATRKTGGPASTSTHGPSTPRETPASPPQAMAAAAAVTATPVASAVAVAEAAPAPPAEVAAPISTAPAVAPPAIPSGEEGEVHKKARRFAKLLVDEIKLYNQGKVTEGRQNRDLYERLKDDIEKSRASYEKRYGNTAAKDGDYFNQELIRILADNDSALLGNNFRR